jgi:hypothetical protein
MLTSCSLDNVRFRTRKSQGTFKNDDSCVAYEYIEEDKSVHFAYGQITSLFTHAPGPGQPRTLFAECDWYSTVRVCEVCSSNAKTKTYHFSTHKCKEKLSDVIHHDRRTSWDDDNPYLTRIRRNVNFDRCRIIFVEDLVAANFAFWPAEPLRICKDCQPENNKCCKDWQCSDLVVIDNHDAQLVQTR